MIESLGESGKLVLAYARRIATNLHHREIAPVHLLLAIGDLEDLAIRRAAEKAGLDIDELCAVTRRRLRQEEGTVGGPAHLGAEADSVLSRAEQLAIRSGTKVVEAPHILAALVGLQDGPVADGVRELKVDWVEVQKALTGLAESGTGRPRRGARAARTSSRSG